MLHGGEIYDKKIELDFSVNLDPNPCPKEILSAISRAAERVSEYPDRYQTLFRESVARAETILSMGKKTFLPENILGGNGASELIAAIIRSISPKKVLVACPCFYGYFHGLNMVSDIEINRYYLKEENDFALDESFLEEITADIDLVILADPNNPTGRAFDRVFLEKLLEKAKSCDAKVLIDECFIRLTTSNTAVSARDFIFEYEGLYVLDAYTKLFSIPGIRVGFCISASENIKRLMRFISEWNMSVFAQELGIACSRACGETDHIVESKRIIKEEREYLSDGLKDLGFKVFDSDTNFILIKAEEDLYDRLLSKGILIRDCSNFDGLSKGYFRLAVRGHFDNERLLQIIKKL